MIFSGYGFAICIQKDWWFKQMEFWNHQRTWFWKCPLFHFDCGASGEILKLRLDFLLLIG